MRQVWWTLSCAVLIGCVADRTETPVGRTDADAAQIAQYAFANSARTYGRPAEAARAVIALELIARQQASHFPSAIQQDLLQGRAEARDALFVVPDTPSDRLVASLSALVEALARNDQPAAIHALSPTVFTRPPEQVLDRLSNMPYLRMANVATSEAAEAILDPPDDRS